MCNEGPHGQVKEGWIVEHVALVHLRKIIRVQFDFRHLNIYEIIHEYKLRRTFERKLEYLLKIKCL